MTEDQIYSLCEAVADISYIAGSKKYHTGNSRADISEFIRWAKEFEEINKGSEWGINTEKDYIEAIEEFTLNKMKNPLHR